MNKRLASFLAALAVLCLLIVPVGVVFADSYDVSATVPAPLPPDLPVITTPNNTTVSDQTVVVYGTCIIIDPSLIVVLERNGVPIGSGTCTDQGTFQISITLVLGVNVIRVKFMTITGESGGYGTPLTVSYNLPESAAVPAKNIEPAKVVSSPLSLNLNYDFVTYKTTQKTLVIVSISGGNPPYKLFIGWGDGTSKNLILDKPDTFDVSHFYLTVPDNPMKLVMKLEDAGGASVQEERALVTFEKQPGTVPVKASSSQTVNKIVGVWFAATAGTLLVAALSYNAHFAANAASRIVKGSHLKNVKIRPKLKRSGKR